MKKIIGLTLAALLIVGIVSGGTWAFFSDSEASQNNTLMAGTLDLQVGATDPCMESIDIGTQILPGDSGNAADWTTTNLGSVSGTLRVTFGAITNFENSRTEPEQAAGDATAGATEGELGGFVDIALWLDVNRSGGWDSGDKYLGSDGSVYDWVSGAALPPAAYNDINNYAGLDWDSSDGMPTMAGSADLDFMVEYDFPVDANDNRAQSDSSVFDITFILEQA
jgi:predicted ribosomally synthesized peptide with SipW-like signal peptide